MPGLTFPNLPGYIVSKAKAGSGGSSSPASVDSIAELVVWLKADAGVNPAMVDGTSVQSWIDQGPRANTFVQNNPVNQPVYKVNIINGLPVVRFDGANFYLQLTTSPQLALLENEFHCFFVGQMLGAPTTDGLILEFVRSSGGDSFLYAPLSNAQKPLFGMRGQVSMAANPALTYDTNPFCMELSHNYLWRYGNVGDWTLRWKGNNQNLVPGVTTSGADTTEDDLGRNSNGGALLRVDMGELIVYRQQLTGSGLAFVRNYLASRWGVAT